MAELIRGADIHILLSCPHQLTQISELYLTFMQIGVTILELNKNACTQAENGKLDFAISQEDSLKFNEDQLIQVQMRVKLKTGKADVSKITEVRPTELLKEGVI